MQCEPQITPDTSTDTRTTGDQTVPILGNDTATLVQAILKLVKRIGHLADVLEQGLEEDCITEEYSDDCEEDDSQGEELEEEPLA